MMFEGKSQGMKIFECSTQGGLRVTEVIILELYVVCFLALSAGRDWKITVETEVSSVELSNQNPRGNSTEEFGTDFSPTPLNWA